MPDKKFSRLYIIGGLGVIALCAVYFLFNPAVYNFFPACPFHKLTGFDCPGCGSQRAIHALLKGDLLKAMDFNLLLVLSIPFLLIHFTYRGISVLGNRNLRWKIIDRPATPVVIAVIVFVFWIARNLPYQGFVYLAA